MSNSRSYKHRETFKYKGLTYRYDKTYGEWKVKEEVRLYEYRNLNFPFVIFSSSAGGWSAGYYRGDTPQAALKKWEKAQLVASKVHVKEALKIVKENKTLQRILKSKRWKK